MVDAATTALVLTKAVQGFLSALAILELTSDGYPPPYEPKDGANFDFIVVGGGTAGCVVANRLTENPNTTVLIIEAGKDPQLESELAGLFSFTARQNYDYNYQSVNDGYTAQNLQENIVRLTAGKALGGTSVLDHTIFFRGDKRDLDDWAKAANSSTWGYDSMLPYFIKSEKVTDEEILNSSTASFHGTNGYMGISREPNSANDNVIKTFEQLGYSYNLDINSNVTVGITQPFVHIFDNKRSSSSKSYLGSIKKRKNLFVWKDAKALKILFDSKNNAIGVKVQNSNRKSITVNANKEVILSAGVFGTPQLLMLSGIGPQSHLKKFNIAVKSNLPVGENFQDRVSTVIMHQLDPSIAPTPPLDPTKIPVAFTVASKAMDNSQSYSDFQLVNLFIPHDFVALVQLCVNVYKLNNNICNKIAGAIIGRNSQYSIMSKNRPKSRGTVLLASTDPLAAPIVNTGLYSNPDDLNEMASYLLDYSKIQDTPYFKSVNATFVDLALGKCNGKVKNSLEFWKCYALEISFAIWHYCGTAALGTVVDSSLKVKGVSRLRVVDASAIPNMAGNLVAPVVALAEKASDLIKADNQ